MKNTIILLIFSIQLIGCVKKQFIPDITFIKIGRSETLTTSDSLKFGSAFYIQTDFQQDSMYIKINVQPQDIDSIDFIWPLITLKAKMMDKLKNACLKFVDYSIQLPNGNLPNAYFEEPVIYNGGAYLIYYKDSIGVEHYFCYVLKDLSPETQHLHYLFMDYCQLIGLSKSYERKFTINSDSIARTLSFKKNMKCFTPLAEIKKHHPIYKFIPKAD
ncbi:MAG: hypothetical protein IPK88_14130 [Saprospiraceae bacterium]|uniref:Uncharacterized protein n=1 Tax=Candidatus Defluviibacterium haderslevense TaxID=2981993 RepID=A0A9D7SDR2_9BACT|nr:hypothetical protein [Candidatus Defluviibacterium haderslevense]MBK9719750.1 hypothetical protein [Candidatus Defluviibacterium haderslevense]